MIIITIRTEIFAILDKRTTNFQKLQKRDIKPNDLVKIFNEKLVERLSKQFSEDSIFIRDLINEHCQQEIFKIEKVKEAEFEEIIPKPEPEPILSKSESVEPYVPKEEIEPEVLTMDDHVDNLVRYAPKEMRFMFRVFVQDCINKPTPSKMKTLDTMVEKYKHNSILYQSNLIIPYQRPTWLAKKQNYIVNAVMEHKNYLIHGDRQTGKDSSIAVGKFESLITKKRDHPLYFMASSQPTARSIMAKIIAEELFSYIKPHIHTATRDNIKIKCQEGGLNEIKIIATTEEAVKGITGELWVDDIDTIIKAHKEYVLTKAVAITRSNPDISFVFTSNMGKGAYIKLLKTWEKAVWKKHVEIIELKRDDVQHIDIEKDAFLFATMEALSGKDEAEAQLNNVYNKTGDSFDVDSVIEAYETYDLFMTTRLNSINHYETVMGIDPSGTNHPFGWWIARKGKDGVHDNYVWEVAGGEIQLGDPTITEREQRIKTNNKNLEIWTFDKMVSYYKMQMRNHHVTKLLCESNSSGFSLMSALKDFCNKNNILMLFRNFEGSNKPNSHANKTMAVRYLLDNRLMVFNCEELYNELFNYDPSSGKTELKGDVADAMHHVVYELVGGVAFLNKINAEYEAQEDPSFSNEHEQIGYY